MPLVDRGIRPDRACLADLIAENSVLLEIKAVGHIPPLHEAQVRPYLRLSACRIGPFMKVNTTLLKDGLRRYLP